MIKESQSISVLENLRERAYALRNEPTLGENFRSWHADLLEALTDTFGADSGERKQFENLRFRIGIGVTLQRHSVAQLEALFSDNGKIERLNNNNLYRQLLADAADELLVLILRLRRDCKS